MNGDKIKQAAHALNTAIAEAAMQDIKAEIEVVTRINPTKGVGTNVVIARTWMKV